MSNLDLKLISGDTKSVLLAGSNFGEAASMLDSEFLEKMKSQSDRLRSDFALAIDHQERGVAENEIQEKTRDLGEALFNGLFVGEVLSLFNRTIGGAKDGKVTIRLMLGDPSLNLVHWELMRFRGEFVGFRHNLIRHPFVSWPVRIPSQRRPRLRICAVAVDPLYGPRTVAEEHQGVMNILSGFGEQVSVISLTQEEATVDNILDVLFEGVDIWHFCGHGLLDEKNPIDSSLVVWPSRDERFGKLSIRMLTTLATTQNLGFCFLNACDTGRGPVAAEEQPLQTEESFASMAHSLIEAGVPMVLATNHQITVAAATFLSRRFYTGVVKHARSVDQAVRDARAELFLRRGESVLSSDWSCPALYARSRHMGLGAEELSWVPPFDIYSVRNIEPPALLIREEL